MLLTKLPKTNFDFLIYHEKNKNGNSTQRRRHIPEVCSKQCLYVHFSSNFIFLNNCTRRIQISLSGRPHNLSRNLLKRYTRKVIRKFSQKSTIRRRTCLKIYRRASTICTCAWFSCLQHVDLL